MDNILINNTLIGITAFFLVVMILGLIKNLVFRPKKKIKRGTVLGSYINKRKEPFVVNSFKCNGKYNDGKCLRADGRKNVEHIDSILGGGSTGVRITNNNDLIIKTVNDL